MPLGQSIRSARPSVAGRLVPFGIAMAVAGMATPAKAQFSAGGLGYGHILPNLGPDVRVGDLRPQLEGFLQPQASLVARPAWLITPTIESDIGLTDNAQRVASPRRADVFAVILPQVLVSGDTPRLKANLSYTPQFTVYANNSNQNQVYQFFNGQALVALVPDAVFIDLRGAITQQFLTSGGFNQVQTQSFNRQNSVQTISFGISPYAEHRFGGWGTGTIRYTFDRTLQDTQGNQAIVNTNPSLQAFGQPGYGSVGNLSTSTELATFTTGENLGRFNDSTSVTGVQYNGTNSYRGAYRQEAQTELGYAVNHTLTLLAGIGYENLAYGGNPGYRINQGTYNVGFSYAPNPDTKLTVQYGRHDGNSNVNFDGQFAPTARMRVVARYTTGITTDLEQAQGQLNSTTVGSGGLVTDTATGAPVSGNGYNGLQNGVYRLSRLSATLLFLQDRNSYSFSISNEQRTTLTTTPTLLSNGLIPAGTSTNATYGSVGWQHDLAPDMSFSTTGQYGVSTNTSQFVGSGSQNQTTLSLSAALSKQFTETLSGTVRYTYTNQSGSQFVTTGGLNLGSYAENILLLGLRKSF